ncbi:hypothetical protein WUBG_09300, partial [Wuchereria bancrofti]
MTQWDLSVDSAHFFHQTPPRIEEQVRTASSRIVRENPNLWARWASLRKERKGQHWACYYVQHSLSPLRHARPGPPWTATSATPGPPWTATPATMPTLCPFSLLSSSLLTSLY